MPRVSIVVPAWNAADFIEKTLSTVAAQTFRDFELIVVDDGSTDGGREVVDRIADSRLRVVGQPTRGECEARNRGIRGQP